MKNLWFIFILLSCIWGSSFVWIKIGVLELGPLFLVAYRLTFSSLACGVLMLVRKEKLPRNPRDWVKICIYGVLNPFIPFLLIAWAEVRIPSGTAALLNGSAPFFAYLTAHFMLTDERLNLRKICSLTLGFSGLALLYSHTLMQESNDADLWGKVAVTVAAACYGLTITWTRKALGHVPSLVLSSTTVFVGCVLVWLVVLISGQPLPVPQSLEAWASFIWLGVFGTGVALFIFFALIKEWGATRASLVLYTFPLVGFILGYIFLGERLGWLEAFGGLSVIGSVLFLNRKDRALKKT